MRHHRRLVARAGADLEHLVVRFRARQIGHQRHDVGLRDGLPVADRQAAGSVGISNLVGGNELVAGHPRHDGHHPLIEGRLADLGAGFANECGDVLHHSSALGREVLGGSGLCRRQGQDKRCGDDTDAGCDHRIGSTTGSGSSRGSGGTPSWPKARSRSTPSSTRRRRSSDRGREETGERRRVSRASLQSSIAAWCGRIRGCRPCRR